MPNYEEMSLIIDLRKIIYQREGNIPSEIIKWLKDQGFDWPLPTEQAVEFKLRYL